MFQLGQTVNIFGSIKWYCGPKRMLRLLLSSHWISNRQKKELTACMSQADRKPSPALRTQATAVPKGEDQQPVGLGSARTDDAKFYFSLSLGSGGNLFTKTFENAIFKILWSLMEVLPYQLKIVNLFCLFDLEAPPFKCTFKWSNLIETFFIIAVVILGYNFIQGW